MKDRIVADGPERIRATDEYEESRQEGIASVQKELGDELEQAGFLRGLWIRLQMRLEVRRRLRSRVPDDACYLLSD